MPTSIVAIGFSVASALVGSSRIQAGKIPGGKVAVEMHIGPYDKIEEAYNRLSAFVNENGLEMDIYSYEFYLNDPCETPPEELKTEIYFPIK